MNHKRPPIPAVIVILLLVALSAYFIVTQTLEDENGSLAASGTIEAVIVNISPELAGRVKEVLVQEGQFVESGTPLLSLDDSLLAAQRQVAQSGVDSARQAVLMAESAYGVAQAQYDATLTAARAQQSAQRLTNWSSFGVNSFEQPAWYFSRDEQMLAAQAEVEAALLALGQAKAELEEVVRDVNNSDFVTVETRLSAARMRSLIARSVRDHAQAGDVLTAAQDALDEASTELEAVEQAYDELLSTEVAERVLAARAALAVTQERYEVALDTVNSLQTGEQSPQVKIAAMGLEQAKAALEQAESAVDQAAASLALLETQIARLTVYTPMEGVILTRNIEPGEFVQPGSVAFAMADLNNISITVFVPEDRYGQISLGQSARVTVDSFPGETFTAEVIQIGNQAEFTPRNVQTVEGRSSTVYAIKLKVTDSEGRLKIGMPADVTFN